MCGAPRQEQNPSKPKARQKHPTRGQAKIITQQNKLVWAERPKQKKSSEDKRLVDLADKLTTKFELENFIS